MAHPDERPVRAAAGDVVVDSVHVQLGGAPVLSGITASFRAGALSAILGPNGAGKSTLVRAILDIVNVRSGQVRIAGRDVRDYPARELARTVSFVPQDTHIGFSFRVEDLVMMGRYPHLRPLERERPADRQVVGNVLRKLDLERLRRRDVTALSAGERQRVLVARALATEAGILVADEPVSNLDIGHRLETVELLQNLAREGYTVVVVLHDIELALRFADRVVLLDRGLVVQDAAPAEVSENEALERVFGIAIERRDGTLIFHRRRTTR